MSLTRILKSFLDESLNLNFSYHKHVTQYVHAVSVFMLAYWVQQPQADLNQIACAAITSTIEGLSSALRGIKSSSSLCDYHCFRIDNNIGCFQCLFIEGKPLVSELGCSLARWVTKVRFQKLASLLIRMKLHRCQLSIQKNKNWRMPTLNII